MGKIFIIEPEPTTNLLFTPSFEDVTAGLFNLTAIGSTVTRSVTESRFGRASARVVTDGAVALQEGVRYRHSTNPALANSPITVSVYARGGGRVRLRVDDVTNGIVRAGDPVSLRSDFWQRLILTSAFGAVGGGDLDIYVEIFGDPSTVQSHTFYIDGFQLEALGHVTSYVDGDLELSLRPHGGDAFFRWQDIRHGSPSLRSERYRGGGRLRDVTQGLDFDLWPTNISGFGMPRFRLQTMSFDTQDEVLVQRSRPRPRALMLTFWASKLNRQNPGVQRSSPASLRTLHKARQALENLIKPDLVQETQPLIMRYEDGAIPMELAAFFETGLEFSGDIRNPYQNQFSTRFFVPDPLWKVDSQDQCELTDQQLVAHDGLLARIDGRWRGFDVNGTGVVNTIAVHPVSGDVYVAGSFTEMEGDTDCARICRFPRDGSDVEPLNVGIDDGQVFVIAFLNDGRLVVGGSFTNIDAVAHNNVAIYDPDADSWSTTGPDPGLNGAVRGAATHRDGNTVFLGGDFTASFSGSVTPLNRICEYSISADNFSAMTGASGNGVDGTVDECIMDMDGTTLLFCGAFTQETGAGADTLKRVGIWDGSTFAQMGLDGAEGRVRHMRMHPNGHVYVVGDFTNIGFNNAEKCAVWNRTDFFPLGAAGDGLTGGVSGFGCDVSAKGLVLFVGDFTGSTGIKAGFIDGITSWDGTRFGMLDMRPATNTAVNAVAFNGDDIWIGGDIDGNAEASAIHTCANNGKARAGPVLDVLGPCNLIWLENQTTGQVVRMQFEVLADEELLIDLRPGHLSAISSFRGNVIADILPESNHLLLLPGTNTIAFFADGTTANTEHVLHWQDRHWSFDDSMAPAVVRDPTYAELLLSTEFNYDASLETGLNDNDPLGTMTDQGPNGYDAGASAEIKWRNAANGINGVPAYERLVGPPGGVNLPNAADNIGLPSAGLTIFVVRQGADAGRQPIGKWQGPSPRIWRLGTGASTGVQSDKGIFDANEACANSDDGEARIDLLRWNPGVLTAVYKNGTLVNSAATPAASAETDNENIRIFIDGTGTTYDGKIGQIVGFAPFLNLTDINTVLAALGAAWSIPVVTVT